MARIPSNHRLAERDLIKLVHDGEWEIDPDGSIWRVCIRTGDSRGGTRLTPCKRRRVEKLLPSGYLMVRAMRGGRRVCGLAHRLVWQHFKGDIPEGMTVNHDNGIRDDNHPNNFVLATYSDQAKHAHGTGLLDQHGQRNPAAKLTDNQIAQIRLAYASGRYTMDVLAKRFGVSFQHISKLVRGQRRPKQGGPISGEDQRHSVCERDQKTGRFVGKRSGRLLDGRTHDGMPA